MTQFPGPADFRAAMAALGLAAPPAAWRDGWAESQAAYPADGPAFLREGFVRDLAARLGLEADVRGAIVGLLATFEARPVLRRLAWHCHRVLFAGPADNAADFAPVELPWPTRPVELPPWGEAFYAPVLLSGGPGLLALHAARGIPAEVTRDTVSDLGLWMRHYRAHTGRWGLAEAGWLANHFLGRLHKLGRLQFRFERFASGFHAYRHAETGRVLLLAPGGARFRRDGQFDGATGVRDEAAWVSTFSAGPSVVRGHPVSPDGRTLPAPMALGTDRWRPILQEGDPVLGVHIPATGAMAHAACGASFRRAVGFFGRHFPQFGYKAFHCASWFLDNQLGELLPEASNIRRFQEEVYLYPLPGASDGATFDRVFGRRYADLADAPRDTALRREIVRHVQAGGHFHGGGCLLFPEDLDWGGRVYRRSRDLGV